VCRLNAGEEKGEFGNIIWCWDFAVCGEMGS